MKDQSCRYGLSLRDSGRLTIGDHMPEDHLGVMLQERLPERTAKDFREHKNLTRSNLRWIVSMPKWCGIMKLLIAKFQSSRLQGLISKQSDVAVLTGEEPIEPRNEEAPSNVMEMLFRESLQKAGAQAQSQTQRLGGQEHPSDPRPYLRWVLALQGRRPLPRATSRISRNRQGQCG